MLTQLWNSGKPTLARWTEAFIVPMLCFAPLFMQMGILGTVNAHGNNLDMNLLFMSAGTLGVSFSLLYLYKRQQKIIARLDKLEQP